MKILDKLSRILGSRAQPTSEPESHVLDPFEIRLIAEGKLERLADFAASARLHSADPKGDTPLHLAARTGNLALCDLFIRSGADPDALNHERHTPADVAFTDGHGLTARLLSSLVTKSLTREKAEEGDIAPRPETGTALIDAVSEDRFTTLPLQKPEETSRTVSERFGGTYWTEERHEELTRLWSLGAEPGQIAKKLGGLLTSGAILNEIHRLGIYNLRGMTSKYSDLTLDEVIPKTITKSAWPDERVDLLKSMWAEGRSASQIARELGGVSHNAVLSKVHRLGLSHERQAETGRSDDMISGVPPAVAPPPIAAPLGQPSSETAQTAPAPNQLDDLDDLLGFEAEEEPEEFFGESASETVSGTFVALVSPAPVVSDDEGGDWDLDLSPASIAGEGIGAAAAVTTDHGAEHDFLKVRNRGRQSVKRAVVQTGTRLSIDPEICITWAEETLAKGWYSFSDIESLVALCEGNGDLEELRINLLRNLEAAGVDLVDQTSKHDVGLWDASSNISSKELAEAIEATLTRSTRLPGTQRFVMDKSDELQLLEPMVRAKQELQLEILACEAAVETILDTARRVRSGYIHPSSFTLANLKIAKDTEEVENTSFSEANYSAETSEDRSPVEKKEKFDATKVSDPANVQGFLKSYRQATQHLYDFAVQKSWTASANVLNKILLKPSVLAPRQWAALEYLLAQIKTPDAELIREVFCNEITHEYDIYRVKRMVRILEEGATSAIQSERIYNSKGTNSERLDLTRTAAILETISESIWPDERVDLLKVRWAEGKSASQIASEFGGVSRSAVISKVHRLGLSNKPRAGMEQQEGAAVDPIPKTHEITQGGDKFDHTGDADDSQKKGETDRTREFFAGAENLKSWQANGRAMDGKQRREALAALETLDLSQAFHKELVSSLEQKQANSEQTDRLHAQISVFEAANERLIHEHLPYVRRFAARNVEEGEDPEDVFQVAFMGLQRSTRRFDPERGYRFVVYASYWMRQAIMRWRADEGAAIRIPVHRKEKIARLDLAMEKLDVRADGTVSDNDLAVDMEWTTDEVSQFRAIPREAEYPESIEDWDEVLPEQEDANTFDQAETESIITDALAELPEREADVIRMRFGIGRDADMTLEEIGQIYGVTRERIRQIEAKGLDRLSHPGRKRRLQELLGM